MQTLKVEPTRPKFGQCARIDNKMYVYAGCWIRIVTECGDNSRRVQ